MRKKKTKLPPPLVLHRNLNGRENTVLSHCPAVTTAPLTVRNGVVATIIHCCYSYLVSGPLPQLHVTAGVAIVTESNYRTLFSFFRVA
ncbi:hypothetical protein PIB30_038544, partial [Stylosanthes scabra]|nr:hypothetical protein [Stylosanthes scabra]